MPEARRGENTRADILLLSHGGRNLPIEAKRHFNSELWTAPEEQLAGYAADEGAFGYGIYLVFWFGTEYRVPTRPDGGSAPASAVELEAMLRADLPLSLAEKISVTVLDVSRPETVSKPKLSRKKSIQSEPLLSDTKKSDQR